MGETGVPIFIVLTSRAVIVFLRLSSFSLWLTSCSSSSSLRLRTFSLKSATCVFRLSASFDVSYIRWKSHDNTITHMGNKLTRMQFSRMRTDCGSGHLGGGGFCLDTLPWADTPFGQTFPGRHPTRQTHPGQTPPLYHTCLLYPA